MGKSIWAVAAGYLSMAILVLITTTIAAVLLVNDPSEVTAAYLVVNFILGFLAAIVGGWVTAKLAPQNRKRHVQILAVLVIVLGILSAKSSVVGGSPAWYPWVIMLVGAGGALVGGNYYEKKNA